MRGLSQRDLSELENLVLKTLRMAGTELLEYYGETVLIGKKDDGSPLTRADQASHEIIMGSLSQFPFVVVSEEAPEPNNIGEYYWLVDPLDGTKDFLAQNDEFAINIALIRDGRALLGGIYAPALDELYFGVVENFAWREKLGKRLLCIDTPIDDKLKMAVSRFHDHPSTSFFADANGVTNRIPTGASLKYGRLATGEIDVYPRLVGTSEWDTAAGQAILEAAGGQIIDWVTGLPLTYGKPRRRNSQFLAFRRPYTVNSFDRTPF